METHGKPAGNPQVSHGKAAGNPPETRRKPAGNPQEIHRKPASNPPETYKKPTGNLGGTRWKTTGNPPGTHRKPGGNPEAPHGKPAENLQETEWKPAGNPQETRRPIFTLASIIPADVQTRRTVYQIHKISQHTEDTPVETHSKSTKMLNQRHGYLWKPKTAWRKPCGLRSPGGRLVQPRVAQGTS